MPIQMNTAQNILGPERIELFDYPSSPQAPSAPDWQGWGGPPEPDQPEIENHEQVQIPADTAAAAEFEKRLAEETRRSFDAGRRAVKHGNHPFGAVLVDDRGHVLLEAENAFMPSGDGTAHAERLLCTQAATSHPADVLARSTLYSSAEPCAMCAGAIYWVGIGRLVYGLGEARLKAITGAHPEKPTLDLPCRTVFAAGQKTIDVVGPLLEDEAAALHEGFWQGIE